MAKVPVFVAPKLQFPSKHVGEVPFLATLAALTQQTLLSSIIDYEFRISMVRMLFADNHLNNVRHYWLCSHNMTTSATGPPPDDNVFSLVMPTPFIVGDNQQIRLYPNYYYYGPPSYLKLHVNNLNAFAVQINASVYIEEL